MSSSSPERCADTKVPAFASCAYCVLADTAIAAAAATAASEKVCGGENARTERNADFECSSHVSSQERGRRLGHVRCTQHCCCCLRVVGVSFARARLSSFLSIINTSQPLQCVCWCDDAQSDYKLRQWHPHEQNIYAYWRMPCKYVCSGNVHACAPVDGGNRLRAIRYSTRVRLRECMHVAVSLLLLLQARLRLCDLWRGHFPVRRARRRDVRARFGTWSVSIACCAMALLPCCCCCCCFSIASPAPDHFGRLNVHAGCRLALLPGYLADCRHCSSRDNCGIAELRCAIRRRISVMFINDVFIWCCWRGSICTLSMIRHVPRGINYVAQCKEEEDERSNRAQNRYDLRQCTIG